MIIIPPMSGPTAWGAHPANAVYDVNWVGDPNGTTRYDLASYLGTWLAEPLSPIDGITVARFSSQLAQIFQREKDLRFATEMAMVLSVRNPAMIETVEGVPTILAVNSVESVAHTNFFCLQPTSTAGANFPLRLTNWDYYLPETNLMWMNKVMVGICDANPDGGVYPVEGAVYDGSPRLLQYAVYAARRYAVTGDHIFQYHRQSANMWNATFAQTALVGVAKSLRKYFMSAEGVHNDMTLTGQSVLASVAGEAVASLHYKINGVAPISDDSGMTLWSYINGPRVGFLPPLSLLGVQLGSCVPGVYADIWIQTTARCCTLAWSPFLVPHQKLTGISNGTAQIVALGAGAYGIPLDAKSQQREIAMYSSPTIKDEEVFNSRLAYHAFAAGIYQMNGNLVAAGIPTSPNVVSQRWIRPDFTTPALMNPGVLTAKTNWMPSNTQAGLRLVVGVAALNNAALFSRVMVGRSFTTVPVWTISSAEVLPNTIIGGEIEDDGIWQTKNPSSVKDTSTTAPSSKVEVPQAVPMTTVVTTTTDSQQ
jgi:hypothetical protein